MEDSYETGETDSEGADGRSGCVGRVCVCEPPLKALKKLSEIFNIDMNDLATKKLSYNTNEDNNVYYLDDDARDMAQFLYENPDYKVLFDASRKVKKEDIQFVKEMIDRMSNKND